MSCLEGPRVAHTGQLSGGAVCLSGVGNLFPEKPDAFGGGQQ